MQEKFEFSELRQEHLIKIQEMLPNKDLAALIQTSSYYKPFFKQYVNERKLSKLLVAVAHGKHNEVEQLLATDISLLFQRGNVTDCSSRTFKNISPFEYALWALDKHMWSKMLACIPRNEEGMRVFAKLLEQYNKVSTTGITYTLNDKTITEKHFDFENTIIKELKAYISMIDTLKGRVANIYTDATAADMLPIEEYWSTNIRAAQKLFPIHLVYEYCSIKPFELEPKFIDQPESSTSIFNTQTKKTESWFSTDSEETSWCDDKGAPLAIIKSLMVQRRDSSNGAFAGCDVFTAYWSKQDLSFIQTLYTIRTKDFIELQSQLTANELMVDTDIIPNNRAAT